MTPTAPRPPPPGREDDDPNTDAYRARLRRRAPPGTTSNASISGAPLAPIAARSRSRNRSSDLCAGLSAHAGLSSLDAEIVLAERSPKPGACGGGRHGGRTEVRRAAVDGRRNGTRPRRAAYHPSRASAIASPQPLPVPGSVPGFHPRTKPRTRERGGGGATPCRSSVAHSTYPALIPCILILWAMHVRPIDNRHLEHSLILA